jgi:hypothetical protein
MIAVLYAPDTGVITQTIEAGEDAIAALGRPYLEVPEARRDWDVTHRVDLDSGELVERT